MSLLLRHTLALLLLATLHARAQGPNLPAGTRFILSHFAEPGGVQDERLYISHSPDGLTWQTLNGGTPVWQPAGWQSFTNVVRDPAIIHEGGWFWVAYTSGNYGRHQSFGLVKSTDLVNWIFVGEISAVRPGATDQLTWNPVWFRDGDGSVHLFISLSLTATNFSPVPNMQVHEMHPLNADFTQWSVPALIDLPHNNTNELWVWKEGATYHALYIYLQAGGNHYHSTSTQLLSGWSAPQLIGLYHQEGGMMLPRPGGGYRMFLESGYSGLPTGYRIYDFDANFASLGQGQLVTSAIPMRNGKMIAAPATTTFAQWQTQWLGDLPAAQQAPDADPDGDGRSNLLEAAIALNPRSATDPGLPYGFSITDGGQNYLALSYRRLPSLAGVSCTVESAAAGLVFAPAGAAFAARSATLLSDGSERVEMVDVLPMSSGGSRFVRLQVTQAGP